MGVDDVVANRPKETARVKKIGTKRERPRCGRITEKHAPIESESEPSLGPPSDPLHKRIGGDEHKRARPEQDRKAVEGGKDQEAKKAESDRKGPSACNADRAGRDRPSARAGNLRIEIPVDDVIIGAAGAPHDDRAEAAQSDRPNVREALFG